MGTMLGKAAAKFERAFVALPDSTKSAVALAMYRAAPAIQQYQRDLEALSQDPAIVDAVWDIAIATAFRLVRGRNATGPKQIEEMKAAAPETSDFVLQVGRLISGMLPGMGTPLAIAPVPPRDLTVELDDDDLSRAFDELGDDR